MRYSIIFCVFGFVFFNANSFSQTEQQPRPKVGLVLSGGAAKGIAHIGVLKVLEEAGLPIDYIGGTSMGSIIGCLYAIGYDAASLEDLVVSRDWPTLLGDKISLSSISIEEKESNRKFFLTFPSEKMKISLPKGLSSGQNITTLLSDLLWPYHEYMKFSDLPIPFLCVASDITNGRQEVLTEGYLLESVRASMAIPSVFTPVEINGKIFVDGGLINNFPVKEVINMGADIIIGVDCGFRSYKNEEINSLTSVIEQTIYILAIEKNDSNKNLCNILIEPDMKDFSGMDFSKAGELIKLGEEAARKHYKEIREIADSINRIYGIIPYKKHKKAPSIFISEIETEGLSRVSERMLEASLKIQVPVEISSEELSAAINRAYGTQFFEAVNYKIEKRDGKNILKVFVQEKQNVLFRIGGHYDSDFNASLLLNATVKNALIKGSKLFTDLKLGNYPSLDVKYIIPSRYRVPEKWSLLIPAWKLRWFPDVELKYNLSNYPISEYSNGDKIAGYDYISSLGGINLKSSISNSLEVGTGAYAEYSNITPDIVNEGEVSKYTNTSFLANFYLKAETFDKYVYPSKGIRLFMKADFIKDIDEQNYTDVYKYSLRYNQAFYVTRYVSILANCYGGYTNGDSVPPDYLNYSGGLILNDNKINVFPFVGLELFEKVNKNALSFGLDLQIEIFKNQFIQLRSNFGKTEPFIEDLFKPENIFIGYGLTYGYRSFIGPIEFSVMKNNLRGGLLTYVNIGIWF